MTKHELKIGVNTTGDLVDTLKALRELRTASFKQGAKADFLAMANERWDLGNELWGLPDPSLGLTEDEARVLAAVADEFLRNAYKALDPGDPEGEFKHGAPGVIAASHLGLAAAELVIKFDDAAGVGEITVSHPIIPDLTPPLDLETVRKTRPQQFRQGRSTRGGIYEIETGAIHSIITRVGLEHLPIKAEDQAGDDGIQRRTVKLRFQRKA